MLARSGKIWSLLGEPGEEQAQFATVRAQVLRCRDLEDRVLAKVKSWECWPTLEKVKLSPCDTV